MEKVSFILLYQEHQDQENMISYRSRKKQTFLQKISKRDQKSCSSSKNPCFFMTKRAILYVVFENVHSLKGG